MKRLITLSLFISLSFKSYCQDLTQYKKLSYEELNNLISDLYQQGKYNDAIPLTQVVITKAREGNNDTLMAEGLVNLGALYNGLGNYNKALPLYLEGLKSIEKIRGKEHPSYATSLNNLAALYMALGNYSKALPLYLQVKDIDEKVLGKEHLYYTISLNNLAFLQVKMGNYNQALSLYLQAKNIREKVMGKEHPYYATSLNNLAGLYESQGHYDKALPLYIEAMNIRESVLGKEHSDYAASLNNLAGLHITMGNYAQALPLYLQALDIGEKVLGKEHPRYAFSLNNLAFLYEKKGNYQNALPLYLKAKEIRGRTLGKAHPLYLSSLNNLASLYKNIKDYNQSWKALNQAISSNTNIKQPITLDKVWSDSLLAATYLSYSHLENMIRSLEITYQLLENDKSIKDAVAKQIIVTDLANALLVKARNQVSSEEDKLRMLSFSNDWLQKSLNVLTPEVHTHKAFNLSDQNKSVLLLQATKSELAYGLGELPDSLVWQNRKLLKTQSQLQAKLLEKRSNQEKDGLRNELNDVNQSIDKLLRIIEKDYPKYHKIKYQQADINVQDVQALLDENTAFLEYVIADSVVNIFCVHKEQVQWSKSFITNKELKDRIKELHFSLSDYTSKQSRQTYLSNAHWFYKHLIAPVLKDKSNITNLIIVTDGELGHLPFETFLVEEATEELIDYRSLHYLLNDYNISYNYSAALWKENIEGPAPRNNGQIMGVAANYDITLDTSMLTVRLPTDQWTRAEISPLPGARKEVEILQEKYEGFFAFDTLASEKTVKAKASDYSILHFATHGILDSERPVLSSLAFTEDNDSTESNFWQAHEISKLRLNADLVVLSACETGFGKFEKGNGIASLARSFMYAGAPSLIVSLWQVRDEATAELMKNFYNNLDNGMKKDEALRKAKLNYIKSTNEAFVHPAYWAPFIMIGKTDTVEIKRKSNVKIWGIGVGVLTLLAFAAFMLRKRTA